MKTIVLFIAMCVSVSAVAERVTPLKSNDQDTIEINIGKGSKTIIIVEGEEDLELLKKYDLNEMIREIELHSDKDGDSIVIIHDEEGARFIEDSLKRAEEEEIIVLKKNNKDEFDELEEEFEEDFDNESRSADWKNYDKKHKHRRTQDYSFIEFGMNNYMKSDGTFPDADNAPYTVKPWGSWWVALGPNMETKLGKSFSMVWGPQFAWYNFKYQDPKQVITKVDTGVVWVPQPPEKPAVKSKLAICYLNFNLMPVVYFGDASHHNNRLRMGLGGYASYRVTSWSKYVWKDNGTKRKDHVSNNFYLENFRYGVKYIVGYGDFDFFVNYDLSSLHSKDRGPDLNAFSFGISF